MLRRLLHSTAVFVAIVVAYQVYVLAAVPWIEPPLAVKKTQPATLPEIASGGQSVTKYQRILATYFPRDHWSQIRPPKVIENETGSVMFVLDDYQRQEDGRVDLTHFALLIFPTPRQQSVTPPRDAIILEAPQGARLQFDKNFHPERGEIGEIQVGEFPGAITIRSDMRDPGPEDDLLIETSDLRMNSRLLYSNSDVRFRLGPNVGSGKELEIRLLAEDTATARSGLKIASVDMLEIRKNVRLRLFLNSDGLLPGRRSDAKPVAGPTPQFGDPTKPPVEVTCTGPFHFDFIKYVAGFDKNVEVWQLNPNGPSDQLSCNQLDLHFARKVDSKDNSDRGSLDTASQQRADIRWLEPDRIVAIGQPVVIVSPARQAEVRGGRVQLMLRQRKVAVDGGQEVLVAYGPNVLRAPQIQYQHPADDAGTKIGAFRAIGPGTLHYIADSQKPDQAFQAEWQASIELGRHNGQPVLTIAGRPRLSATSIGMLTADQMRVFLREVESDGKTLPLPDRMLAVGQVEIDSPELLARTRELTADFHVEPEAAMGAGSGPAGGGLAQFNLNRGSGSAEKTYQVQSDLMHLDVALRGRRAAPKTLSCDGNVAFREIPNAQLSDEEIFQVRGNQLIAEQLDTSARITIRGAPAASQPAVDAPLAEIRARGMIVHAADVQLDVGQNRLWIEGPGIADMTLKRDLTGRENATTAPLEMKWQGGLVFDGRTISIERNVLVTGPDDQLRCDQLAARLSSAIEFGKRVDQKAIEVAEVECRGNVAMDHRPRDEAGAVVSHERMEVARLAINQQSGAISGDGPGVIRSTHFADQLESLAGPGAVAVNPLTAGNTKLHFLRVDFQSGLAGNFITREIEFQTRVRTVYGPVDAWEQELDINRPELLPPETITLTSDALRVNEDSLAVSRRPPGPAKARNTPIGPVQFQASGNVRIDGQSPKQGMFAATADRVSYEQVKELFVMEGSNRLPATLWHRDPISGQQVDNSAGKIMYNRTTGLATFDAVRSIEFTPGAASSGSSLQNALRPAPARQ